MRDIEKVLVVVGASVHEGKLTLAFETVANLNNESKLSDTDWEAFLMVLEQRFQRETDLILKWTMLLTLAYDFFPEGKPTDTHRQGVMMAFIVDEVTDLWPLSPLPPMLDSMGVKFAQVVFLAVMRKIDGAEKVLIALASNAEQFGVLTRAAATNATALLPENL